MPEIKHSFEKGRMNKDLDERLVPNGEYRDALNVEVSTSESSNMGAVQTTLGNMDRDPSMPEGYCIGSIANERNDKLYWLVAGDTIDFIAEYDFKTSTTTPVCVDLFGDTLKFNPNYPVTGINIIDDLLFWTDNNSEPKRIHIDRCKLGTTNWQSNTQLVIRDTTVGALPNTYHNSGRLLEEHITVIRKSPPAAPVLEMKDTSVGDHDGDGVPGETTTTMSGQNPFQDPSTGDYLTDPVQITLDDSVDYTDGDYIIITSQSDTTQKIRAVINTKISGSVYMVTVMSGDPNIQSTDDLFDIEIEQPDALFQFKFPRFATRYKYEDGEYSTFSPFTEVAFLPGEFDYMPKEGYNLGMVNRLRNLIIKDFVHDSLIPDDVISIDVLYKESNSPSVYTVITIRRQVPQTATYSGVQYVFWDAWNAIARSEIRENGTRGFLRITSEMIHAVVPSNQLLRPWDNVPRKALAQEITGNRLVYGNYLQNYDLTNASTNEKHIDIQVRLSLQTRDVGGGDPEQRDGNPSVAYEYLPGKSVKSLRTYQVGVVYIDKYGRETPVFSKDKRGVTDALISDIETSTSMYVPKSNALTQNKLRAQIMSTAPEWAEAYKFFIKETSNEYYNLAMDRWYNAEDGNVWISFPSAERNKVDEDTFLVLKKEHDTNRFVDETARYKCIAIKNEAPYFIKLTNVSMGTLVDNASDKKIGVDGGQGFPIPGGFQIYIKETAGISQGWLADESTGVTGTIQNTDISQIYFRIKSIDRRSNWYRLKSLSTDVAGGLYAILESDELFEEDMSFTSPDLTWNNRIKTLELEIVKRVPEDKPEFDGRFFVKILKDFALITRIIKPEENDINWIVTSSKLVQYIAPMDSWSTSNWDGYGTNRKYISFSPHAGKRAAIGDDNSAWVPGKEGASFWKMASKGVDSSSSGWFIDKVEGFRRFKYTKHFWNTNDSYRTNENWSNSAAAVGFFANNYMTLQGYPDKLNRHMQVCGLNTYGDSGTSYLGVSNIRPPVNQSGFSKYLGGSNGENSVRGARKDKGGKIPPSIGIDEDHSIIHLSIAGIEEDHSSQSAAPTGSTASTYQIQLEGQNKNAADLLFINELTTPGTVFSWKEDPGQVKYIVTQPDTSPSSPFPYSTEEWDSNSNDYFDGGVGVSLYNYAIFRDYLLDPHHEHWVWVKVAGKVIWSDTHNHCNFASQKIGFHDNVRLGWCLTDIGIKCHHAPNSHGIGPPDPHYRWPNVVWEWGKSRNKRRRFMIHAKYKDDETLGLGKVGPHYYLPTNDPDLPAHFDNDAEVITSYPSGATTSGSFETLGLRAPGVRTDGIYSGYSIGATEIPNIKTWDATVNSDADQSVAPGSVTWQVLTPWSDDGKQFTSTNPAIFETEPKEDVGLDIYHEVGQIYPIKIDNENIELIVGPIHNDLITNSHVKCFTDPGYRPLNTNSGSQSTNIRVSRVLDDAIQLHDVNWNPLSDPNTQLVPNIGDVLIFTRSDGSTTEASVVDIIVNLANNVTWYRLGNNVHNKPVTLPWFNCYSFGNGVESNRIRDDYNQVMIDKGPKASTTLEEPYLEERRCSGLIHSGIYNSTSGINNLNQFIQAEPITKDLNPIYGCIQKLHTRNTDLVTLCEDKVFKILANKDAIYSADGNPQLTATGNVLGQTIPFTGEYGISTNPESFASEAYRAYFADKSRGAVLRLSQDGLTPISSVGMKDWFSDNLRQAHRIIGSIDDKKSTYNITLVGEDDLPFTVLQRLGGPTLSGSVPGQLSSLGEWVGLQDLINPYENIPDPSPEPTTEA